MMVRASGFRDRPRMNMGSNGGTIDETMKL
jgi:hypothetical protein